MIPREKITANKTVIAQMLEVYSPNLITPGISTYRSKSKEILIDFVKVPFCVKFSCRMLRQCSSHDDHSCSDANIEWRSNSFHYSNMTKLSDMILNNNSSSESGRDEIEILDAMNEELNNRNISVVDSAQEEESEIENDFNNM